jgi:hypothetical protein
VGVLVALTTGLVFLIVAWALGVKAFDAFLVTVALVVGAVTWRMFAPFVKQLLGREPAASEELGAAERAP